MTEGLHVSPEAALVLQALACRRRAGIAEVRIFLWLLSAQRGPLTGVIAQTTRQRVAYDVISRETGIGATSVRVAMHRLRRAGMVVSVGAPGRRNPELRLVLDPTQWKEPQR